MHSSLLDITRRLLVLFVLLSSPAMALQADLELLPSGGTAGDHYGTSVATDGSVLLVGAPEASMAGRAYVHRIGTGAQLMELIAGDGVAGDRFGAAVAIDAGLAIVGAPSASTAGAGAGAVYVFDAATGTQLHKLAPADGGAEDRFGGAVAIAQGRILVGATGSDGAGPDAGAAYVFDALSGVELHKLVPSDASFLGTFGGAVDLDGDRCLVGAHAADSSTLFSGAAYVFDAGTGAQLHKLAPQLAVAWAGFGCSVAIDGATIVVGAKDEGPKGKHSGAAYVFDVLSGQQTAKLFPSDGTVFDRFGTAVDVSGERVLVGAPDDAPGGTAYLYSAATGSLDATLSAAAGAAGDELGAAVAMGPGFVLLGAPGADALGSSAGAAYVFAGGAQVNPLVGCQVNLGLLAHVDGLPIPGQPVRMLLADGQPGATAGLLGLSTQVHPGLPGCGQLIPGAGELLLDGAPGSLLPLVPVPLTGASTVVDIAVPPQTGLIGLTVHVQAALLAPATAEPVRLTSALSYRIGGLD